MSHAHFMDEFKAVLDIAMEADTLIEMMRHKVFYETTNMDPHEFDHISDKYTEYSTLMTEFLRKHDDHSEMQVHQDDASSTTCSSEEPTFEDFEEFEDFKQHIEVDEMACLEMECI